MSEARRRTWAGELMTWIDTWSAGNATQGAFAFAGPTLRQDPASVVPSDAVCSRPHARLMMYRALGVDAALEAGGGAKQVVVEYDFWGSPRRRRAPPSGPKVPLVPMAVLRPAAEAWRSLDEMECLKRAATAIAEVEEGHPCIFRQRRNDLVVALARLYAEAEVYGLPSQSAIAHAASMALFGPPVDTLPDENLGGDVPAYQDPTGGLTRGVLKMTVFELLVEHGLPRRLNGVRNFMTYATRRKEATA